MESFCLEIFNIDLLRTFKDSTLTRIYQYFIEEKLATESIRYEDFKSIFSRFQMNSFYLSNSLFQPVAAGVYTLGAFFNHSCVPNSIPVYDCENKIQTFRALRAIKAGEEITHSYVDLARSTLERRVTLRKDYGFECDCHYCSSIEARSMELNSFLQYIDPFVKLLGSEGRLTLRQEIERSSTSSKQSSSLNKIIIVDSSLYLASDGRVVIEDGLEGFEDFTSEQRNDKLQYELSTICRQLDDHDKRGSGDECAAKEQRYENYILALRQLIPRFNFFNRSMYSMMSECYSIALDLGYNEEALEMIERLVIWTLAVYRPIPHHPIPTLLLLTYGQLKIQVSKEIEHGRFLISHVIKSLRVLFPPDHQYISFATNLINEAT